MYAIVETGGKQYKVAPGQVLEVEYLGVAEGNNIELDKVLLVAGESGVTIGTPTIEGAKVSATSQGETKGKKVVVLRYKSKVRYHKKTGHRQLYTRLVIDKIVEPASKETGPAKKVRQRKKEVIESGT